MGESSNLTICHFNQNAENILNVNYKCIFLYYCCCIFCSEYDSLNLSIRIFVHSVACFLAVKPIVITEVDTSNATTVSSYTKDEPFQSSTEAHFTQLASSTVSELTESISSAPTLRFDLKFVSLSSSSSFWIPSSSTILSERSLGFSSAGTECTKSNMISYNKSLMVSITTHIPSADDSHSQLYKMNNLPTVFTTSSSLQSTVIDSIQVFEDSYYDRDLHTVNDNELYTSYNPNYPAMSQVNTERISTHSTKSIMEINPFSSILSYTEQETEPDIIPTSTLSSDNLMMNTKYTSPSTKKLISSTSIETTSKYSERSAEHLSYTTFMASQITSSPKYTTNDERATEVVDEENEMSLSSYFVTENPRVTPGAKNNDRTEMTLMDSFITNHETTKLKHKTTVVPADIITKQRYEQ